MSLDSKKYSKKYYNHVLNKKKVEGNLGIVFDLISDLTSRRGLRQEFELIDEDIQTEIVDKWLKIISDGLGK